jgi:hypothetical protein
MLGVALHLPVHFFRRSAMRRVSVVLEMKSNLLALARQANCRVGHAVVTLSHELGREAAEAKQVSKRQLEQYVVVHLLTDLRPSLFPLSSPHLPSSPTSRKVAWMVFRWLWWPQPLTL